MQRREGGGQSLPTLLHYSLLHHSLHRFCFCWRTKTHILEIENAYFRERRQIFHSTKRHKKRGRKKKKKRKRKEKNENAKKKTKTHKNEDTKERIPVPYYTKACRLQTALLYIKNILTASRNKYTTSYFDFWWTTASYYKVRINMKFICFCTHLYENTKKRKKEDVKNENAKERKIKRKVKKRKKKWRRIFSRTKTHVFMNEIPYNTHTWSMEKGL